jgi:hypothetical protein
MRFLLTLLLVLAVAPGASASDDNLLGLFYDTAADVAEIEVSANSMHTLYLVLINPVNDAYDGGGIRDVSLVWGFECAIEPPAGDVLLGIEFPGPAINLGTADNIVAGYATAVPVASSRTAMLASISVLTLGNNPEGYRLAPASPASLPGLMAYVDYDDPDDNLVGMNPVSGAWDRPVFTFGDYTIEQNLRWGGVKSLFR